ncbi:Ubiquitin-conjugating enzyme E2 16 [Fulvia fulva]|uniref:Ubiquitin-conjugating enzyme E2 16 n=1 Tax=Passalora fulva TaxID=5499 RepID=A0A9Q8LBD3_PASFU|nr:Ubiquitin-conjugating enzyme E2 16 [Fulvia fulva]KAK4631494.1 Ubiquitin-conjugating enzyme E2 16 [Fulvia fulva]KAK4632531.1 Ubiquitin-conjugating enzyme E2 16 [Fulvia fulva]UJO14298.1 Ubiquitin-conjugating enzyme E2 16 [Fulvia fulva]WPV10434.1 Ubiquitin-conjugating enzyme E2 16 [Fulvia fulva]WPV26207.1 Ubiquitin-conjugating enzyme E2 16 [Fulvia fulva]
MATKRLIKELDAFRRSPSSALTRLEPQSDEDLFHLVATLKGPEGTAYEGGLWHLTISIPPTYPNTAPEIRFQTPICHPNVNFKTGEICLDLLKTSWTPAYGVVTSLEAVSQLLSAGGEPESPLNVDIARLYRGGDWVAAEGLVRFYTRVLAMGDR